LPEDFLETAYKIRNKYYPETKGGLQHPTSSYNAKKIRGMCEICNEELGQETHHLAEQKFADQDGFIGTFHKNHSANLVSLCTACHLKQHTSSIDEPAVILGKKKTTKGYKLIQSK
jgi:DNA mismatch repair protein MutS